MGLYKEIGEIFDYLISVRKLKTYLSFDIELPQQWKIPKRYVNEEKVVETTENKNSTHRSISFVSEFKDQDINDTIESIKNIINYNKELELKEKLLQQKIHELKKIFETTDFDNLQSLKFDLIEERLTNGEEILNTNGEGDRLVEE